MDYCYVSAQQASSASLKNTGREGPASHQSANHHPRFFPPPLVHNWRLGGGSSPSIARAAAGVTGLEEGLWQMSLQQEETDAASGPYPERPGEPNCQYFMRNGVCGYGTKCRFNHPPGDKLASTFAGNEEFPERIGQPECQYYLKTGMCKFGVACKFHHPREKVDSTGGQVQFNFLGLPLRPGEKECAFYLRMGSCKFGLACKFHHPEPAAVGTLMPVPGSPLYTATGTPSVPLPGTYQSRLPSWPVARSPPYMPGPQLQGISSYMPVIVSPPHTISIPSWRTYQGPINPVPSPDGWQQTELCYGGIQHQSDHVGGTHGAITLFGGIGSPVLQPQMGQKEILYPERLGQPDCDYYMRTGDCKFGASCKFHHPKIGLASSSSCSLSIIGLPLRPGQPPCTFYIRYGICKFGPTCKFDHPVVGLPYNSSMTSLFDMAMPPYPRGSSPNTVLASASPGVLHEASKPQNSTVQSEAPSTNASADGECEEVNL